MKKILDGDKVEKKIMGGELKDMSIDEILYLLVDCCTLSPAELAGILGGDSWKWQQFKWWLGADKLSKEGDYGAGKTLFRILERKIKELESQAPVSKLVKRAKEDRRKAEAFDKAVDFHGLHNLLSQEEINELLAQSNIPPKTEEESDEQP